MNLKRKAPPLYMPVRQNLTIRTSLNSKREAEPSSGVIVSVKLSRSAGSGKSVFIVEGRSSSVKSVSTKIQCQSEIAQTQELALPFCTLICAAEVFGFFFAAYTACQTAACEQTRKRDSPGPVQLQDETSE